MAKSPTWKAAADASVAEQVAWIFRPTVRYGTLNLSVPAGLSRKTFTRSSADSTTVNAGAKPMTGHDVFCNLEAESIKQALNEWMPATDVRVETGAE
jgi:hypothetical protein